MTREDRENAMKHIAALVLAACIAGGVAAQSRPAAGAAQGPARTMPAVFQWLYEAAADLRGEGYTPWVQPEGNVLVQGQEAYRRIPLEAGREYQIIGLCDGGCDNLDLLLHDPQGRTVELDRARDDVPVLRIIPPTAGTYRLRIQMSECRGETGCFFGITVVGRPAR